MSTPRTPSGPGRTAGADGCVRDRVFSVGCRQADIFAGGVNTRGGVRVAVKGLDGDDRADLLTGAGTGGGSRVTAYAGPGLAVRPQAELFGFDAVPGFAGGCSSGDPTPTPRPARPADPVTGIGWSGRAAAAAVGEGARSNPAWPTARRVPDIPGR